MSERDTGGPAFPRPMIGAGDRVETKAQEGMTLRDWFAGQAMASIPNNAFCFEPNAAWCYNFADAMLKERNK